jgi:hypothetical protein
MNAMNWPARPRLAASSSSTTNIGSHSRVDVFRPRHDVNQASISSTSCRICRLEINGLKRGRCKAGRALAGL